jgi:hypothetical protein
MAGTTDDMATTDIITLTAEAAAAGHIAEGSKRTRRELDRYSGLQYDNDGAFIGYSLRANNATSEFFGYDEGDEKRHI